MARHSAGLRLRKLGKGFKMTEQALIKAVWLMF
jgi:hypothetical protein